MMTIRAYYQDAYTATFMASILAREDYQGNPAVILDKSYFYPASGGQPYDTGTLNGIPVIEVIERVSDRAVLHVIEQTLVETVVKGEIDWSRRFDHMQQHTGQHILSQAFIRRAAAETVSFHLSGDYSTVDVATHDLTAQQLREVELLANQVVWEDRPVHVRFAKRDMLGGLVMRKDPGSDHEELRVIDIEEFDLSACGGTHVASTGEVGLIKIVRVERSGGNARITFLCGRRALEDYDRKNQVIIDLVNQLTTGQDELLPSVERLQSDLKSASKRMRTLQSQLIEMEAEHLLGQALMLGDVGVVEAVFVERNPNELRQLANRVIQLGSAVALLASYGARTNLVFARSEALPGNMSELIKAAFARLGGGGGGGNSAIAQGGGPSAERSKVQEVLLGAREQLTALLTEA